MMNGYNWYIFHHFNKGHNFCDFMFVSCKQLPSQKKSNLKGKKIAPKESEFFPFRVDPFTEGKTKHF